MHKAGLALAHFALAIAPHAARIWVVCGPGNNGKDGLIAAMHLKQWGKEPVLTQVGTEDAASAQVRASLQYARQAQLTVSGKAPENYDLCIDALFGTGLSRPLDAHCTALVAQMNASLAPVIAVDVPSGLNSDTGAGGAAYVKAHYTLSLLTLKPGLFTADGRDACGEIWFNALDIARPEQACAELNPTPVLAARAHNTHKGSFGSVAIVGGAAGMSGAALLAARAALHAGAGRVYLAPLDAHLPRCDILEPGLMFRQPADLDYSTLTVVAGCGGSTQITDYLESIICNAAQLVLDADALNALAQSPTLQHHLKERKAHTSVLTPHPLEAARLLQVKTATIQNNRLQAAQTLAEKFACTIVLKGSGTVIAAPNTLPRINITGNPQLASAGSGDVLAGVVGARLAQNCPSFTAACAAVFQHGQIADDWPSTSGMTAQDIVRKLGYS